MKLKPKRLASILAKDIQLASEDWDFTGEAAGAKGAISLRAHLLWETCRHLVIDSSSGMEVEKAKGSAEVKGVANTAYRPVGRLGRQFYNYFPGGNLALSAVVQQFLDHQGTIADVKVRIRTRRSPWIPGNYPSWTSALISDAHRTRFARLAWPSRPVEAVRILCEADINDLCAKLKRQLQDQRRLGTSSPQHQEGIMNIIIRASSWECYSRDAIEEAACREIRRVRARPKGITDMQLKAKLEGLVLLRLVLAYGKKKAPKVMSEAKCVELKNLRFATKPWSPDWAKKCTATIRFMQELFPDNESVRIISERFEQALRI